MPAATAGKTFNLIIVPFVGSAHVLGEGFKADRTDTHKTLRIMDRNKCPNTRKQPGKLSYLCTHFHRGALKPIRVERRSFHGAIGLSIYTNRSRRPDFGINSYYRKILLLGSYFNLNVVSDYEQIIIITESA